jgi:hypothetical protein
VELISSMDSNIKYVNNSIDSEDNPFVIKQPGDKIEIDENGDLDINGKKLAKRRARQVTVPSFII